MFKNGTKIILIMQKIIMTELLVNLQRWKFQKQWQILLKKKQKTGYEILDVGCASGHF